MTVRDLCVGGKSEDVFMYLFACLFVLPNITAAI